MTTTPERHRIRPESRSVLGAAPATRRRTDRRGLLVVVTVALVVGPFLVGDPNDADYTNESARPSWEHPLGTDLAGRDMLARTLVGGRYSLGIAALVSAATLAVGLLLGLVAGLAGGWIDKFLSRVFDVLLGLPWLVVALAIVGALGPGLMNMVIALTVIGWAFFARLARNETIGARDRPDVVAARMAGFPSARSRGRTSYPTSS